MVMLEPPSGLDSRIHVLRSYEPGRMFSTSKWELDFPSPIGCSVTAPSVLDAVLSGTLGSWARMVIVAVVGPTFAPTTAGAVGGGTELMISPETLNDDAVCISTSNPAISCPPLTRIGLAISASVVAG